MSRISESKYKLTRDATAAAVLEYLLAIGAEQTAELLDGLLGDSMDDTTAFEQLQSNVDHYEGGSQSDTVLASMVNLAVTHTRSLPSATSASLASTMAEPVHVTEPSTMTDVAVIDDRAVEAIVPDAVVEEVQPAPSADEDVSDQEGSWSGIEIALLRAALKRFPASRLRKAERFAAVSKEVGTRSKKECYDKYQELLAIKRKRAAQKPSEGENADNSDDGNDADDDNEESNELGRSDYGTAAADVEDRAGEAVKEPLPVDTDDSFIEDNHSNVMTTTELQSMPTEKDSKHAIVWKTLQSDVLQPSTVLMADVSPAVDTHTSEEEIVVEDIQVDSSFDDDDNTENTIEVAPVASSASASITSSFPAPVETPKPAATPIAEAARERPEDTFVRTALSLNMTAVSSAQFRLREMEMRPSKANVDLASKLRFLLYGLPAEDATKKIVLKSLNEEWMTQGLFFGQEPGMRYGLVQGKGGPCGALAVVQAEILRHFYYSDPGLFDAMTACDALEDYGDDWSPLEAEGCALDPSEQLQQRALVLALTDIIWRCRPTEASPAVCAIVDEALAVPSARHAASRTAPRNVTIDGKQVSYNGDGLTEYLKTYTCTTKSALAAAIEAHLPLLTRVDGPAIPLLVYSCILTRGVDDIQSDMDIGLGSQATLIGAHNYATQELVNLLIVGRAFTNVFDGVHEIEEGKHTLQLRGIPARPLVGFLTLFEAYGYMQVGQHFKQPVTPLWVVCAESHYSVLFAAPKGVAYPEEAIAKVAKLARKGTKITPPNPQLAWGLSTATFLPSAKPSSFDLLYFDGLGRQDSLIRLTISVQASSDGPGVGAGKSLKQTSDDPPLELVIRTRWPHASVDWNGVEPIL